MLRALIKKPIAQNPKKIPTVLNRVPIRRRLLRVRAYPQVV
jgi:hypothetical protein